jgi:hypothetical protein
MTVPEVHQLMEAEEAEDRRFNSDTGNWLPPPSPEMANFLDELERRGLPWTTIRTAAHGPVGLSGNQSGAGPRSTSGGHVPLW